MSTDPPSPPPTAPPILEPDRPRRRSVRKAATRAQLLAVARARFAAEGYAATTIRQVAADAGVAVGTVHAHFSDKTALLFACFLDQIDEAVVAGWRTLDATAPLLDQLCHLAGHLYRAYARHPALSREMFRGGLFPADPLASARHARPFLEAVAERVRTALPAHRGAPDLGLAGASGYFALYVSTLIAGLSGLHGEPEAADAAERWTAALRPPLAIWLRGLAAPQTDHIPL